MLEKTYWKNAGEHQGAANFLDELVPISGQAETLKGEIWRAATKIYYDFYNNGFGNNWTSPASFLIDFVPSLNQEIKDFFYMHGKGITVELSDEQMMLMEEMINEVVKTLSVMNDEGNNIIDMWEYSMDDSMFIDADNDEIGI